jgi:hypothetical protein
MGIEAQAGDDRGNGTHGGEELKRRICAVTHDDELTIGQPPVDEAGQLASPDSDRFVLAVVLRGKALGSRERDSGRAGPTHDWPRESTPAT